MTLTTLFYIFMVYMCLGLLLATVTCGRRFVEDRKRGKSQDWKHLLGMGLLILFGWPILFAMMWEY